MKRRRFTLVPSTAEFRPAGDSELESQEKLTQGLTLAGEIHGTGFTRRLRTNSFSHFHSCSNATSQRQTDLRTLNQTQPVFLKQYNGSCLEHCELFGMVVSNRNAETIWDGRCILVTIAGTRALYSSNFILRKEEFPCLDQPAILLISRGGGSSLAERIWLHQLMPSVGNDKKDKMPPRRSRIQETGETSRTENLSQGPAKPNFTVAQIAQLVVATIEQILANWPDSNPPFDQQAEEIRDDDVINISRQQDGSAAVTSAESVDGSAMMTPAVMSSQSAVSYSISSRKIQYIQTRATVLFNQSRMYSKRCLLDKLKRRRLNYQSLGNPDASFSDPVARTSRPTTGVPAASTDFQMVSLPPAGQPDASTSYHTVLRPAAGQLDASTSYHPVLRPASGQPVASTSSQLLQ
ncbi:hypothetical protein F511_22056 [Dorcoceras hygrometricum]|uniref:Uncharacterized protein n=1 Tax=Dorcoceras hygrometricum TaxID=472368 RepID=A0A2Z7C7J3_9LAMI|nr:hypothetical protein F511_22056 [Dorcoceras hygrometricum]